MKINKYVRSLLFCVGSALLLFVLNFIQTTWFQTIDSFQLIIIISIVLASELMLKILKTIKTYEIANDKNVISTNKVVSHIVFVIGVFLLSLIVKQFMDLLFSGSSNQDVRFFLMLMIAIDLMCIVERIVYEFDPSHNGDVYFKKK